MRTVTVFRDSDGRAARWEVVTEPEFDAEERDSWYALAEYEDATCPQCGNLRSVCSNPDGESGQGFYPQRSTCYVTVARDAADRRWRERHKDAEPDEAGVLPTDGTYVWASPLDLSPDDDFLGPLKADWLVGFAEPAGGLPEPEQDEQATDERHKGPQVADPRIPGR